MLLITSLILVCFYGAHQHFGKLERKWIPGVPFSTPISTKPMSQVYEQTKEVGQYQMRGLHTAYSEPTLAGSFVQSVCPDLELHVECTNYHQSIQNSSVLWKPRAIDPASQRSLYLTLSKTYRSVLSLTYVSQKTLLWSRWSWLTLNFKLEIELPQHEICIK